MINHFKDGKDSFDHEKFQEWRRRNEGGYFINVKSPTNLMLHRAICPHLGDSEWERETGWGSLTRSLKICSESMAELQQFVTGKFSTSKLKMCADCKPSSANG